MCVRWRGVSTTEKMEGKIEFRDEDFELFFNMWSLKCLREICVKMAKRNMNLKIGGHD